MTHAGIVVDPQSFTQESVQRAVNAIEKGGRLDIVVKPVPTTVKAAEEVIRRLYSFAPPRPSDLDLTVFFGECPHYTAWNKTFESGRIGPNASSDANAGFIDKYDVVAVGGTFDHLHWGHRLLLTMAAYTARKLTIVGVTGSELLVNKKYAAALDSYDMRCKAVVTFMDYLRPGHLVDTYVLKDNYGPTATVERIDALVVSAETHDGGNQVNKKREGLGWNLLDVISVGIIGGATEKLSSTDLRKEVLERKN